MNNIVRFLPCKIYIAKVILTYLHKHLKSTKNEEIDKFINSLIFILIESTISSYYDYQYYNFKIAFEDIKKAPKNLKIETHLKEYEKQGFLFLKLCLYECKENEDKESPEFAIQFFISKAYTRFWRTAIEIIDCLYSDIFRNIEKSIDEFYRIFNLNESDISKTTFKRTLYMHGFGLRKRDGLPYEIKSRELKDEYQRDKNKVFNGFENYQLIKIYQTYWYKTTSLRKLALEYSTSKSTIQRICNSKEVEGLYINFTKIRKNKSKSEFLKEPQ